MHRIALLPLALAASTLACNLLGSDEPDSPPAAESDSGQSSDPDSGQPADQPVEVPQSGLDSGGGPEFLDLDDPLTYVEPGELDISQFDSGAVYIAKDGGYLDRLEMNGRGTSEMLSGSPDLEGEITYDLNYSDFNQAVDITPPDGCAQETTELKYPVTADAYQFSQVLGIISYKTDLPLEDVVQFYRNEMATAGRTLAEEFVTGPIALLSFTSDAGTVQVTLSLDESTSTSTVDVGIIELG